MLCKCSK